MNLSDFDYPLPPELIAQAPLADRAASRMLVIDRASGKWEDRHFRDLPEYVRPGDCLALNDSRVLPSRLLGQLEKRPRDVELFLLRPLSADRLTWQALARPGRHLTRGVRARFSATLAAEVIAMGERGERTIRFESVGDIDEELERTGHVPLPPYIKRPDTAEDRTRYQTVYATHPGSVAAPTAGLHFTPEMLDACRQVGATIARLTLHVGLGTFQPLSSEHVEENRLHAERFEIDGEAATAVSAARRIIAVGTTAARTLESAMLSGGLAPASGETDLFIYPGFKFQAVGAMLTNFHLPKSSLLLLVSALAGRDLMLAAYRYAVEQKYRFFSYGDCMLIL